MVLPDDAVLRLLALSEGPRLAATAPGAKRDNAIALPALTVTARAGRRSGGLFGRLAQPERADASAWTAPAPKTQSSTMVGSPGPHGVADTLVTEGYTPEQTRAARSVWNSPYVQDTLFGLAGGPVHGAVGRPTATIPRLGRGEIVGGQASPQTRRVTLSADVTNPAEIRSLAAHEIGHVAAYRGALPELQDIAARSYAAHAASDPGDYGSTNLSEYKATLFASAVAGIGWLNTELRRHEREGGDPDAFYRKYMEQFATPRDGPTVAAIDALLARPEYANTTAARYAQRYRLGLARVHVPPPPVPAAGH